MSARAPLRTAADPSQPPSLQLPVEVAIDDAALRARLLALEARYAATPKAREPHPDVGDWWALYDYGPETVGAWDKGHVPPYPGAMGREAVGWWGRGGAGRSGAGPPRCPCPRPRPQSPPPHAPPPTPKPPIPTPGQRW